MSGHRVFGISFASVCSHYVVRVAKKGPTQTELDAVISWLTGYSPAGLATAFAEKTDFETFFTQAPCLSPARDQITGLTCGVRVDELERPAALQVGHIMHVWDLVPASLCEFN